MIKKLYLMPIFALSLAGFALAGCDDQAEKQADLAETTASESIVPTPGTAMTETAVIEQMEENAEATVHVSNARAFATAQTAANGAVFATLHNTASAPDTLLSAKSDVADSVELHQTYMDPQTNTMLMRSTSAVDIAAGQTLTMEASSYHIMLLGLKQPLVQGETFNVTLDFRNAGEVIVPVMVTAPGATDTGIVDQSGHDHGSEPQESYVPPTEDDSAPVDTVVPAEEPATENDAPIITQ